MPNIIIRSLATFVAAFIALGHSAQADPLRLIVTHLQPPLVPNSVMDLALELGYFEHEGVDVELVRVQQTPSAVAAILAGEGDMANVGVSAVLQLHAQGDDTLTAVTSPNKSLPFLIAAKDEISSASDLQGRVFGVGRIGSLDHSLSSHVLEAHGISMAAMEVVTLGQPAVRARALVAGQVDATTMSIGTWLSIPDRSGIAILVPADDYYARAPVVNKVNVVTAEVLETRRDDVIALVRALTRISRDFAAEPGLWAAAMETHAPQMAPETLQELARSFAGGWSVNGGMGRDELQFTQNWVYRTDDFKGATPVDLDSWVDFTVADDVIAELGVVEDADAPSR